MASHYFYNLEHFLYSAGYEINGLWYPRVTSIVMIKAKPALYRYYSEQGDFAKAQEATSLSAKEGTLMHDAIESLLKGQSPKISPSIQPAINAFNDFLSGIELMPLLIEERVKSDQHWYAGTIDLLAKINGVLGLVDIKTSVAVYRDYNLQIAAYVEALKEADLEPKKRWILRVDQFKVCQKCGARLRTKGGSKKVRGGQGGCEHSWGELTGEVEFKELGSHQSDFAAFLACKKLWEWEHDRWLRMIRENRN